MDLKNLEISHSTMRLEDLIPRFLIVLKNINPSEASLYIRDYNINDGDYVEIEEWVETHESDAYFLLEDLFNALDSCAPEGFYFGSHVGDGARYGFWHDEV